MADKTLPEAVKTFIAGFHQTIKDQQVTQINQNYDNGWSKITEKLYKQTEWPTAAQISPIVNDDETFVILYKELYYRHLYSKAYQQITLEHRIGSFQSYIAMFDYLLNREKPLDLELPNQWLWDIIDEFIYQSQEFSQYSAKVRGKTEEEIATLKANPGVWNILTIIKYLNAFIKKSDIVKTLENNKTGDFSNVADDKTQFATHPLYRSLGYFCQIGLQRVHVLLGDYHLAMKAIAPIPLNKKGLYTKVIACYITLYYYTGYAYMMMRRFVDAIRTLAHILLYMSRIKQYHTKSYQYDAIVKRSEQMYALLALLIATCPQRIDETISSQLRDRYADKMALLQRGDINTAEEILTFGSPKFISPVPINWNDEQSREAASAVNANQEALRLQIKTFINELRQQSLLPIIRSYLKLYTTIGVDKLATLLDGKVDQETLSQILLCYNHKTRGLAWQSGSTGEAASTTALGGKMTSFSDIAFYIDNGMIHISDNKAPRRYGDYFIRNTNKFDDIIADLAEKEL